MCQWSGTAIAAHLKRLSHAHLDVGDTEWFSDEGTAYPLEKCVNLVAEEYCRR